MNVKPNFSNYSVFDLEDSIKTINKEKYPENYKLLLEEYNKRNKELYKSNEYIYKIETNPSSFLEQSFTIRFDSHIDINFEKLLDEFSYRLNFSSSKTNFPTKNSLHFKFSFLSTITNPFSYYTRYSNDVITYNGDNSFYFILSLKRIIKAPIFILFFFASIYLFNPLIDDSFVLYFAIGASLFFYILLKEFCKSSIINKFIDLALKRT